MNRFSNVVRRMNTIGAIVGACFLMGVMVLTVANVITRLAGKSIFGTYEAIEVMMIIVVTFAIGYTALSKSHIAVKILVSRLSQRTGGIFNIIVAVISLASLALIIWASIDIFLHFSWVKAQESQWFGLPYLPFRCIFLFGLILFCLVLLIDIFKALSQVKRK
jgi:TRAP-type C4-dicarboxylate transport system permease small subunit